MISMGCFDAKISVLVVCLLPIICNCQSVNYTFNVGEGDNYESVEEFGGSGSWVLTITKYWKITPQCINPTLTISVIDTDYTGSQRYLYFYVDGHYLGGCDGLGDTSCTWNWVTCENIDNYNLTSFPYFQDLIDGGTLSIGLYASYFVSYAGGTCNYPAILGSTYAVWVKVLITCDDARPRPTAIPTLTPTATTTFPTKSPTNIPTQSPTFPSKVPTKIPTKSPTESPTMSPTLPTESPTKTPTNAPSDPTHSPTKSPTDPTKSPSKRPTNYPTDITSFPSKQPIPYPTKTPSHGPTRFPSNKPSIDPTARPTHSPQTELPTDTPTNVPSMMPSIEPTDTPAILLTFGNLDDIANIEMIRVIFVISISLAIIICISSFCYFACETKNDISVMYQATIGQTYNSLETFEKITIFAEIMDILSDFAFAVDLISTYDDRVKTQILYSLGWLSAIFAVFGIVGFYVKVNILRKLVYQKEKITSEQHNVDVLGKKLLSHKYHMVCCNVGNAAIEDIPQIVIVIIVGLLEEFTVYGFISLLISAVLLLVKMTLCMTGTLLLGVSSEVANAARRYAPPKAELEMAHHIHRPRGQTDEKRYQ